MPTRRPLHRRMQPSLRAASWCDRGRAVDEGSEDGGFILLETLIALTLITTVMAAVGMQYVSSVAASSYQRSAATASQLASSRMSELRAMNPTDLLRGRSETASAAQRDRLRLVAKVATWVSAGANRLAYDNDTTKANVVPTTATSRAIGSRTYSVDAFFECREDAAAVSSGGVTRRDCLSATDTTRTNTLRAVVAVTWTGPTCAGNTCALVTSSVIDPHANPTFELNQALPAAPVIDSVPAQKVAIGDVVSKQLTVQSNTGAAPFTWALNTGSLPSGLSISPAGLISGTVAGSPTTTSSKIVVTDAFLRQASVTISWTVLQKLTLATVSPAPSGFVNEAVIPFTLSASGGSGTGYRYTDAGSTLPPGTTVNATTGRVSGTPTAVGTYNVTLSVTDDADRTASTSFTWTVSYRPVGVANPGAERSTANRADSLQMSASGGNGTYTWSATGLPAGLSINTATGLVSGTPTTAGTSSVTVTARDTQSPSQSGSTTFTWTVVAGPAITAPSNQTSSKTATVNVPVSSTCDNTPCTYSISGQPSGISIDSATGTIGGTVGTGATNATSVRVTVTDASGATATTNAFSWTIKDAPTITTPANQAGTRGTAASLSVTSTCGHTPCTFSQSGLPSGLTFNTSTGAVGGTLSSSATTSTVRITITDASGVSRTTNAFTWTVNPPPSWTTPGTQSTKVNTNYAGDATGLLSGGTSPYTYGAVNLPTGLSMDASTGIISGRPTQRGSFTNVRLTVTDASGATAQSGTFTWNIT